MGAIACAGRAATAKRHDRSPGENGSHIDLHLVDQPLVKRVTEEVSATEARKKLTTR